MVDITWKENEATAGVGEENHGHSLTCLSFLDFKIVPCAWAKLQLTKALFFAYLFVFQQFSLYPNKTAWKNMDGLLFFNCYSFKVGKKKLFFF